MASTILVVDDDPTLVHMLREDLEAEGYTVLEGFDGQTALQLAQSAKPQLIVMDVNMPGVSGPQALEVLRNAENTRDIPIVFLSGESTHGADQAADAANKVIRLEKPIDFESFNILVKKLIDN